MVDVHLIVHSIHEVRLNWFFKVSQRFEVWYLSESNSIVVKELNSSSWPSVISFHNNSDSLSINAGEINSSKVLASIGGIKWVWNSGISNSIYRVFNVEWWDVVAFNIWDLNSIESKWISVVIKSISNIFSRSCIFSFPTFAINILVFRNKSSINVLSLEWTVEHFT